MFTGSVELSTAEAKLLPLAADSDEYWAVIDKFKANLNNQIEDYVAKRLAKGKEELTFRLLAVDKVHNAVLEKQFSACAEKLKLAGRSGTETRVFTAFHGTRLPNIKKICDKGASLRCSWFV